MIGDELILLSFHVGMGIYDAMKLCKADVSTVCLGLAASMGAFLLASGTKGKRFCMPNARVMIHQPLGTAGGKVITSIHFFPIKKLYMFVQSMHSLIVPDDDTLFADDLVFIFLGYRYEYTNTRNGLSQN